MATMTLDRRSRSKTWWSLAKGEEKKTGEVVTGLVQQIVDRQKTHQSNMLKSFRLYGNFESAGLSPSTYTQANFGRNNRLTINVIKSCTDTVVARIGKTLPKPTFLTSGGLWSEQKKAKLLDKFVQGVFHQTNFRKTAPRVLRDAVIFGKGFVKIFEDHKKRICIERVFPGEIVVDEIEAINGRPRQMHQIRNVSRESLLAMFPEEPGNETRRQVRDAIYDADAVREGAGWTMGVTGGDVVQVIESWHLPSVPVPDVDQTELEKIRAKAEKKPDFGDAERRYLMDGHDGRHAISIAGHTLLIEAWRDEHFPFVDLDWCGGPALGWWNAGLPIELCGFQYDINKISRKIKESIDWCVPKAFVKAGSILTLSHLDDVSGGIIKYTGEMPVIQALQTISPELLAQIDRQVRLAYEQSGVSQLAATSRKPSGLQSGAALREFDEFQSERFATVESEYQDFAMAVAAQCIRIARRIYERDGEYQVTTPIRRRTMMRLDWADVDLDDDQFIMQVFPSSSLPRTPAGRLAMVQDLINMGYLDKNDSLRLLDFPDLEAVNQLLEATADFTNYQLERILDGHDELPEPFMDLVYAMRHAVEFYLFARTMDDVEEDRLEALRNYIIACKDLMMAASAENAAQAAGGMGGGAAPGTGAPAMPPGAGAPAGAAPPPMAPPA